MCLTETKTSEFPTAAEGSIFGGLDGYDRVVRATGRREEVGQGRRTDESDHRSMVRERKLYELRFGRLEDDLDRSSGRVLGTLTGERGVTVTRYDLFRRGMCLSVSDLTPESEPVRTVGRVFVEKGRGIIGTLWWTGEREPSTGTEKGVF